MSKSYKQQKYDSDNRKKSFKKQKQRRREEDLDEQVYDPGEAENQDYYCQ